MLQIGKQNFGNVSAFTLFCFSAEMPLSFSFNRTNVSWEKMGILDDL